MFITRWVCILGVFCIVESMTGRTVLSLFAALCGSLIIFLINLAYLFRYIMASHCEFFHIYKTAPIVISEVFSLLKMTGPIFLSGFLSFYLSNASKYALERYFDSDILACYGFVAMPVFAIGLLSGFVFRPQLVSMSVDYSEDRIANFRRNIFRQYAVIFGLTLVSVTVAWIIGVPILSWLYHTDLSRYRIELVVLVLAGGFLALSSYQSVILTIMRKQQYILYGYAIVAVIAVSTIWSTVSRYGTLGAAWSYLALMVVLCIIYMIFLIRYIRKH